MAPLTRRRKKRALAAAPLPPEIHPADRLSSLPDEILAQILSFLPTQEAVRTCVLARAWRDVWKFTRRLFITGDTVQPVWKFVERLLQLRLNGLEHASLDECEIMFRMVGDKHTHYWVNRWIHTSLECQVQTLRVLNKREQVGLVMRDGPLVSRRLTRLELSGICLECADLLDGCPALEHLEIRNCFLLFLRRIVSPSLKCLVITGCKSYVRDGDFKISAPCLVSLWLEVGTFMAPLLERMPELVEARVRIDSYWDWNGTGYHDDPMGCCHVVDGHISDADFVSNNEEDTEDYPGEGWVLLEALAQAKHLVLLAHHTRYIFMRMCPTFSNLKTLVLNGYWCEPADCRPLACILEHAPVLENLIVIFSEELQVELEYDIVLEGRPDATAEPTMTYQCLKTVKVKCHTVDKGVQNVLKFLSTLNICFNSE